MIYLYKKVQLIIWVRYYIEPTILQDHTPSKNNLFRKSNARDNELHHENGCIKSSSQLQGEHCKCSSDFFPSECPGLCRTLDFLNELFLPGV